MAAQKLGLTEVPVRICSLTPQQERAYRIADNKLAELSKWNAAFLSEELQSLHSEDFDLDILGFNAAELEQNLAASFRREGLTSPDEIPPVEKQSNIKLGDIFQMDQHLLICGDSTQPETYLKLLSSQPVDMVFTDPPYNVNYQGRTAKKLTIKNDHFTPAKFKEFLTSAFKEISLSLKAGGAIYVCYADVETESFREALFAQGSIKIAQNLIWIKNKFSFGRSDYHWQHEPILYGYKPSDGCDEAESSLDYEPAHQPIIYGWKQTAAHNWYGTRSESTVWEFQSPPKNTEHPTMKPVALVEKALMNSCRAGEVVLDAFGGSGSTLIAAEQSGRIAKLIELDPIYCSVIIKRWQNFTGKTAVNKATGEKFNQ